MLVDLIEDAATNILKKKLIHFIPTILSWSVEYKIIITQHPFSLISHLIIKYKTAIVRCKVSEILTKQFEVY